MFSAFFPFLLNKSRRAFLLVQITYPAVQSQAGERRGDLQPGEPACGAPLRPAPQQSPPRRRQIS
jgi:hypothetical protein